MSLLRSMLTVHERIPVRFATPMLAAIPLLVLGAARAVSPVPAAQASGGVQLEREPALDDFVPPPASGSEATARHHAQKRDAMVLGPSPMFQPKADEAPVAIIEAQPEPVDPTAPQPEVAADSFTISGILGGRRPIAVINGQPVRIGDEIDGGWIVSDIDAASLRVLLTHPLSIPVERFWSPERR